MILLQSAGANTMKKTDWENMDLGGGGGGAKAAEIFKYGSVLCFACYVAVCYADNFRRQLQ